MTRPNRATILCCAALLAVQPACDAEMDDNANNNGGDGDTDADTDGDAGTDAGDTDTDTDTETDTGDNTWTGGGCTAMDILFVIDDSGSMAEEQSNLITNFPKFVGVLDDYETETGAPLEYRLAVATTGVNRTIKQRIPGFPDMPMSSTGPNGKFVGDNCGFPDPWIDGPGSDVESDFSCAAGVGTTGSGTEMPFASLELALGKQSEPGGPNEGFYRKSENSLLVVVIITDEDDCSMENGGIAVMSWATGSECSEEKSVGLYPVEDTFDFLLETTGGLGRFVVVGIGGQTKCSSAFGNAVEAERLHKLIDMCADYGVHGDICAADLWMTLDQALDVMQVSCTNIPPPV